MRKGAALDPAEVAALTTPGSIDSSMGRAMAVPNPLRKVLLGNGDDWFISACGSADYSTTLAGRFFKNNSRNRGNCILELRRLSEHLPSPGRQPRERFPVTRPRRRVPGHIANEDLP